MSTPTQTILELLVRASGAESITPIVKGLEDLVKAGGEGAPRARELLDEFAKLGDQSQLIDTLVKEKAALVELGDKMNEVGGRFNKLQADIAATATPSVALQRSFAATQKSLQDLSAQFGQHEATIARTSNALKAAGIDTDHLDVAQRGVQASIAGTASKAVDLENAVKGAGTEIKSAGEKSEVGSELFGKMRSVMLEIVSGALLLEAALKTIEFGKEQVKGAADLEESVSRIKAVAQGAAADFGDLTDEINKAAKAASTSTLNASLGLGALVTDGLAAKDAIAALVPTLQLAKIAQIDVGAAAKIVADALKAFNLPATEAQTVVDQLTVASHGAAGGLGAMASAAATLSPNAKALGLSFQQTVSILGVLQGQGVDSEKALRGLRTVFDDLAKDGTPLRVSLLGLGDSSRDLGKAIATLSKNTPEARDALNQLDGATRAVILALSQAGPDALRKFNDQLDHTGGAATKTAHAIEDNLKGAFEDFENSIDRVGQTLATPILQPFAEEFRKLAEQVDKFAETDDFKKIKEDIGEMAKSAVKALDGLIQGTDWPGFAKNAQTAIKGIKSDLDAIAASARAVTSIIGITGDALSFALRPAQKVASEFGDAVEAVGLDVESLSTKAKEAATTSLFGFGGVMLSLAKAAGLASTALPAAADGVEKVGAAALGAAPSVSEHGAAMTENAEAAKELADPLGAIADHFKVAGENASTAVVPLKNVDAVVQQMPGPLQLAKEKLDAAGLAFAKLAKDSSTTPAALAEAQRAFNDAAKEVADLGGKVVLTAEQMKGAFTGLNIVSQHELEATETRFKNFFDQINTGSADTAKGLADRQNAFINYARAALAAAASSDEGTKASKAAELEATAATLGLSDVLKGLEQQASRTGVALLDEADRAEKAATRHRVAADIASAASFNAAVQANIAGDKAAEATDKAEKGFTEWGDAADAAALKTKGITANTSHANEAMEALVGGIANARKAFLGVSEAAAHTYDVILKGAFDLGHSDDGSGFDRVARAMQVALTKTTELVTQQRTELTSMVSTVEAYGQAGQKNFDVTSIAVQKQLELMRQNSQQIKDGTFQFGILGQQDLGALQQALDGAISRTQTLIDKAREAVTAFEDAGRQLQDDLDRQLGNEKAIEDRRFQDQIDNITRLAKEANKQNSQQFKQDVENATKLHELKLKQIADEQKKNSGGGSSGGGNSPSPTPTPTGGGSSGGGGPAPIMHFNFTITDSVVATEEGLNKLVDRTTRKIIANISDVRRRTSGPIDNVFK